MIMRFLLLIVSFLIVASTANAQLYIRTDPGINLDSPTLLTLAWIRAHHLKQAGVVDSKRGDTIWQYGFSLSGDTLVYITNVGHPDHETIEKYDGHDTLRYREDHSSGLTRIKTFDSLGRQISEQILVADSARHWSNEKPHLEQWTYIQVGNVLTSKHDYDVHAVKHNNWLVTKYFGLEGRVDSSFERMVLTQKKRKGKFKQSVEDTIDIVHNFFDSGNRLFLSNEIFSGATMIDSFFYYPSGILQRVVTYGFWNKPDKDEDSNLHFSREKLFDEHGNGIRSITTETRYDLWGNDPDTTNHSFEYDSLGRVSATSSSWGRTEYIWGEDNRLIATRGHWGYNNNVYKFE
jgi:YD repeat-containing protein